MQRDPFNDEGIQSNEYANSIDPFAEDVANTAASTAHSNSVSMTIADHNDLTVLKLLQIVSEIPTLQETVTVLKEEISTLTNTINTLSNELETLKINNQEPEKDSTDTNTLEAGLSYIIQKAHSGDDPREIIKYIEEQAQKLLIQNNEGKL